MIDEPRWRRHPQWVHRVIGARTLVAERGGQKRTLGGLATVVWIVLEVPGSTAEIAERIRLLWPEAAVDDNSIDHSLKLLIDTGVIGDDAGTAPKGQSVPR